MNQLLQAKYDLIDELRTLRVTSPATGETTDVPFASNDWADSGLGCGNRVIPLPFDEDFTLGASWREAGTERLDFEVPHTMEFWVVRGAFDLRLAEGEWVPMRQGSFFVLAPGQCHSIRCHERTYLVCAICPPLPIALPQPLDCHAS